MRFFVDGTERETHDAQERIATLRHRLHSIDYWWSLREKSEVHYVFRSSDGDKTFMLLEFANAVELDWCIKRDPQFPYMTLQVVPVVSTLDLCLEIQDFLGEVLLEQSLVEKLGPHPVVVEEEASYVLVRKWQPPFSPLLADDVQRDILRRTVLAQRGHDSAVEISDVNPVGSGIGLHVSRVSEIDEARRPVESTPIFPDTLVSYHKVDTLTQARRRAVDGLRQLGQSPA